MNELTNSEIRLIKRLLSYPTIYITLIVVPLINFLFVTFLDMLGYVLYEYKGPDYATDFSIYVLAFIVIGILMIFIPGILMNTHKWLIIRKKLGGGPRITLGDFENSEAISRAAGNLAASYSIGEALSRSNNEYVSFYGNVIKVASGLFMPRFIKAFFISLASDEVLYVAERTDVKPINPGIIFGFPMILLFAFNLGLSIYCWNYF